MRSAGLLAVILAAAAAAGTGVVLGAGNDGSGASRHAACDRVASTRGSNSGTGTRARPFRSVRQLVRSLHPGQTGCLRAGNYVGTLEIGRRGTAGRPITLRSYPGEAARLLGRLWLDRQSAHLVIKGLYLDGRNRTGLPSPTVNGRNILFAGNDVTNQHTGICFVLGHEVYGVARNVTIKGNRIHDCGRLPATNHDHGVYVSVARETQVRDNWIYSNADLGVHLYPDARRTYVEGNVIDSNGEGVLFGGLGDLAPRDNLVEGNVISNSTLRFNVESHFDRGGAIGSNNIVRRNCIGGGIRDEGLGGIIEPEFGFEGIDNLIGQVSYRATRPGDLRLAPGSPCLEVFTGHPNRVPGPTIQPPELPPRWR
jgi:nitrous oxidase accessory protein NosD